MKIWIRRMMQREQGSTATEIVLVAPPFLILVLALVAFGRIGMTELSVKSSAGAAAREASLSSTSEAAQLNARNMAEASLANAGVNCTSLSVTIDSSGINAPLGVVGTVSATVTCTLDLSDIALPGIPGTRVVTVTEQSPVDPYKERE